ncbi:non-muscle caldesmon [Scomber scombrus]|uniref:non-muscle caldesmon n=1 Tax=Scomber scombrus TaxID=13677 RepID=UPI002DD81565|nr:non-muscle caldesmon [Scomber scombrus]
MSNSLLRRNSSKQGLQNLMRLTAQRSIEDAEELERERRRRARESFQTNGGSTLEESSPEGEMLAEEEEEEEVVEEEEEEEEEKMSNSLLRRNSSKQGLQNLMRLTAQRSIEDAEELERERRRRARESFQTNGGSTLEESSPEGEMLAESLYDGSMKPISSLSLEEDEGFSDWTQRRERRRQQRLQELGHGGEEEEDEEVAQKTVKASVTSSSVRLQRQEPEENEDRMETQRRKEREEETIRAERMRKEKEREEEERRKREEIQRRNAEMEKRKEVKVSYTSKVFLHQEPKLSSSNGDAADEEVTFINSRAKRSTRSSEAGEAEAILETEQRLEKIRRGLQVKESKELEQLKHRQAEAEQELEELKRRREERRRVREEEERRREEEELQRLAKEEEERRQMKEDIERRRMDAAERMKSLSTSGVNEDEMFSPVSPKAPTQKITEKTQSLNRSLKKSNSFKKTQPLVLLPKIDDKLEQYAHAVENSLETRAVKASLSDLPSAPEVASKKNLFEAGDAWSQSPVKELPARAQQEVKSTNSSSPVTGKYEKIPVDDDDEDEEFTNGKSGVKLTDAELQVRLCS